MPSVVFVCVANSFRSQMAEALAKSMAGPDWEVWSAGSHPGGRVHPLAIELLHEVGLTLEGHYSKGLAELPQRRWDYVVTMGCGDNCPTLQAQHRLEWDLADPAAMSQADARRLRDHLARLVKQIVSS